MPEINILESEVPVLKAWALRSSRHQGHWGEVWKGAVLHSPKIFWIFYQNGAFWCKHIATDVWEQLPLKLRSVPYTQVSPTISTGLITLGVTGVAGGGHNAGAEGKRKWHIQHRWRNYVCKAAPKRRKTVKNRTRKQLQPQPEIEIRRKQRQWVRRQRLPIWLHIHCV